MSAAENFKKLLGEELEELYGGVFRFYRSKLELRRKRNNGYDVVVLSGSNKWPPLIDVTFYFGRNYDQARKIEKILGGYPMSSHIQQYSPNVKLIEGLDYKGEGSWEVNIDDPPKDLALTIKKAIEDIAFPFFERFSTLVSAQEALSSDDSWCFSAKGPFYGMLLIVDAALGDLDHFSNWSECLESPYQDQAQEDIEKYREATSNEI